MGTHYRNFQTVIYITAQTAERFTPEKLQSDYDYIEKYIGLDKVYLETHRNGCDVSAEQIGMIKSFLEDRGVTVSGGITTTIDDFDGAEKGKRRLFYTFCYNDPAMRERLKQVSEFTASLFDEIILDDFFFTNCTCSRCIKAKGDRDWVDYRRELLRDVSENLIVGPAKAVNPKVRVVIKYPNWRESYHFAGYVPEVQRDVFDATYTGTETRSPAYTDQHLPEYLSFALMRWMDNAWPGRNGGGWFDTYQCWSMDRYLEQAYLTAFAQAKELMHFCWYDLPGNPIVAAMGVQLAKIDKMLDDIGKPVGVPVYLPFASSGENHLEMRLGMLGIPVDPTPFFPENAQKLLLTESALADPEVIDKLVRYVENGGDAVITTGFFRKAQEQLRKAGLTEAHLTGRRFAVNRYQVTGDFGGYVLDQPTVLFPELVHGNNDSWSLLNGGEGDLHASLLLRRAYGKGRLYIFAVPDNDADLYRLPDAAVDVLRRTLVDEETPVSASGKDFSMFAYDDGSMILYRYVKGEVRPANVTVSTRNKVSALVDVTGDGTFMDGRKVPVHQVTIREDFEEITEYRAEVLLVPGVFRKYRWVSDET